MNQVIVLTMLLIGEWLGSGIMSGNALAIQEIKSIQDANDTADMVRKSVSRGKNPRMQSYRESKPRDPFVPLNRERVTSIDARGGASASDLETTVPKVLGIVLGKEGFRAVLQRANGQRVLVRPGSFLKQEEARVVRISGDAVFLEYRFDENGRTRVTQRRLFFRNSDSTIGLPQG